MAGIGWSTGERLQEMGIEKVAQLHATPVEVLIREFGEKAGKAIHEGSRGIDRSPVELPKVKIQILEADS